MTSTDDGHGQGHGQGAGTGRERPGLGAMLKDLWYAGLGATSLSRDRLRQGLDDLIAAGRMQAEDADRLLDELSDTGQEEWDQAKHGFKQRLRELLDELEVPGRGEIADLEERVRRLEQALEQGGGKASGQ